MEYKVKKPLQMEWTDYAKYGDTGRYYAEPKLDGERCLIVRTDSQTSIVRENGTVKNAFYPELAGVATRLPHHTVLDGEVCVMESDLHANFFRLMQRQTSSPLKVRLLQSSVPVTYVAFDILQLDGVDLRQKTLTERAGELAQLVHKINEPKLKAMRQFDSFDLFCQNDPAKMEGIILKNIDSQYTEKRDNNWLKFKNYKEDDFKVTGVTSEKRLISALILSDSQGSYVGKVNYTGYPQTDAWKKKLVGMTAVVKYMDTNLGKVRFPILKELRE